MFAVEQFWRGRVRFIAQLRHNKGQSWESPVAIGHDWGDDDKQGSPVIHSCCRVSERD